MDSRRMQDYENFESLVKEVFRFKGFKVEDESKFKIANRRIHRVDFFATLEGKKYVVEVKFYRQNNQNTSLIKHASSQLLSLMKLANVANGILVISSYIHPEYISELEGRGITLVSRPDLFNMASGSIDLTERLSSILEDRSQQDYEGKFFNEDKKLSRDLIKKIRLAQPVALSKLDDALQTVTEESCLCSELKDITKGKDGWSKYEEKCTEILRYLFESDLTGWHRQKRTDDGLNRFDLVTRVRRLSDFWKLICNELGSRYVVFEFKNYKNKIDQGQVLTTEKYLHLKALRSVAFIISRSGMSDHALIFSQGSMREHGKLIINLTDEDLCTMLDMKKQGDDPNDFMFDKVDSFLLSLPR